MAGPARRLRMARRAVVGVSEKMVEWQERLALHLRRRCIRRCGETGFAGWREHCIGSRRQRRMIIRAGPYTIPHLFSCILSAIWWDELGCFSDKANS